MIHPYEIEELMLYAAGYSESKVEQLINDGDDLDQICYDNFDCDLSSFEKIANALIKLTPPIRTELTGKVCQAFMRIEDDHATAIAKIYVEKSSDSE